MAKDEEETTAVKEALQALNEKLANIDGKLGAIQKQISPENNNYTIIEWLQNLQAKVDSLENVFCRLIDNERKFVNGIDIRNACKQEKIID